MDEAERQAGMLSISGTEISAEFHPAGLGGWTIVIKF
jgi:hypothetical protein